MFRTKDFRINTKGLADPFLQYEDPNDLVPGAYSLHANRLLGLPPECFIPIPIKSPHDMMSPYPLFFSERHPTATIFVKLETKL